MLVSIVVPTYNEAERILTTLEHLIAHFSTLESQLEVVVVDDGSTDDTARLVGEFGSPQVRVLSLPRNCGKGAALKQGVDHCLGEYIFFVDADLPYAPDFFERALKLLQGSVDAVIGARDLADSELDPSFPFLRVAVGKGFSYIVNGLLPIGIFDTQCGFKGFCAGPLREAILFTDQGDYTLDIELLLVLRQWQRTIKKLPVQLVRHHGSKIRIIRDSAVMLLSVIRIWNRFRRGLYPDKAPDSEQVSTSCPACGSAHYSATALVEGVRFCRCSMCHSLFQNPRLPNAAVATQYSSSYFKTGSICSGYTDYLSTGPAQQRTSQWQWDRLESFTGDTVKRVLDVGCGSGEFLKEALRRGKEAWGNDLIETTFTTPPPFHFVAGEFTEIDLPDDFFDLVVFNDSFEHFLRPGDPLSRCRSLLRPGGYLMLNTPDPDCWLATVSGRRWISLKKEHLVLYRRRVLVSLLHQAGFVTVGRIASWQQVDWEYLAPRVERISGLLRSLFEIAQQVVRRRWYWVPTSGMIVIAKLESSPDP